MKLLYERHQAPLYPFLRARLGDAFEAADVMPKTFLEVWRASARYESRASVKTWLYGIARNKAVDRVRKGARVTLRDQPDETLSDESPSAQEVLEATGDAARLRACLDRLAEVQRMAIRLAFHDDLTCPETAEVEDVALGTIKTRIHHAKKLLMLCLTRTATA